MSICSEIGAIPKASRRRSVLRGGQAGARRHLAKGRDRALRDRLLGPARLEATTSLPREAILRDVAVGDRPDASRTRGTEAFRWSQRPRRVFSPTNSEWLRTRRSPRHLPIPRHGTPGATRGWAYGSTSARAPRGPSSSGNARAAWATTPDGVYGVRCGGGRARPLPRSEASPLSVGPDPAVRRHGWGRPLRLPLRRRVGASAALTDKGRR